MKIKQSIRYDSERSSQFTKEVVSRPGGEMIQACIQCGTCSGVCPLSNYMDRTPRQIIYLAREGFGDEVLHSRTIWMCTSCYACSVECPRGIKITDAMYALKRMAIERGTYPRRFPIPVLARTFFAMVRRNGRTNESQLAAILFLKTNWLQLLNNARLGLDLIRTGRFSMFKWERIEGRAELNAILSDDGKPE
ncbi:4Fe-4S dicluster domain-containing protein [Candidatus Sumerlaeota bacterium]|nr:4Fe-4S dicluster domain-containing protein [Candidatus Sumerlaeota bacterium]